MVSKFVKIVVSCGLTIGGFIAGMLLSIMENEYNLRQYEVNDDNIYVGNESALNVKDYPVYIDMSIFNEKKDLSGESEEKIQNEEEINEMLSTKERLEKEKERIKNKAQEIRENLKNK